MIPCLRGDNLTPEAPISWRTVTAVSRGAARSAPVEAVLMPDLLHLAVLARVSRRTGTGPVTHTHTASLASGPTAKCGVCQSVLTARTSQGWRTRADTAAVLSVAPAAASTELVLALVQLALPALVQLVQTLTLRLGTAPTRTDHHTGAVVLTLPALTVRLLTARLTLHVHLTVTSALQSLALSTPASPGLLTPAPHLAPRPSEALRVD